MIKGCYCGAFVMLRLGLLLAKQCNTSLSKPMSWTALLIGPLG